MGWLKRTASVADGSLRRVVFVKFGTQAHLVRPHEGLRRLCGYELKVEHLGLQQTSPCGGRNSFSDTKQ